MTKASMTKPYDLQNLISVNRYLIIKRLNEEAPPEGRAGNKLLQDLLLRLFDHLQPSLFMDVGANNGSTSLAIRDRSSDCVIHAFEANPQIFAKYKTPLEARGVRSWNLAVSDYCGQVTVYAPLTLSRAYINGAIVPASIKEGEDTGKTSMLLRNEDATYREFEVEAKTLDSFVETHIPDWRQRKAFLWIDVEGASNRVLNGAPQLLERTSAIFIETESYAFWKEQASISLVMTQLMDAGFLPIARDREYGDKQFNVLFVRQNVLEQLGPFLFSQDGFPHISSDNVAARATVLPKPHLSLGQAMQAHIPILIPCFDTVTYVRGMVEQLRARRCENIILVDNASTYGPMREYLQAPGPCVTVVAQPENLGPRSIFTNPVNLALLPQYFCVTDPDLLLNADMPTDFLAQLAALTEQHSVGKAGLALDISDHAAMRDDEFQIGEKRWKIWEWEGQFWEKSLGKTSFGDPVFKAAIDTTFALYNKLFFDPRKPLDAIRVAGRFTSKHLPWYRDIGLPSEEEDHYRRHAQHSYYLRVTS